MSSFSPQGTVLGREMIASGAHPTPFFTSCDSLAIAHMLLLAQAGNLKVLKQAFRKSTRDYHTSHDLPAVILGVLPLKISSLSALSALSALST